MPTLTPCAVSQNMDKSEGQGMLWIHKLLGSSIASSKLWLYNWLHAEENDCWYGEITLLPIIVASGHYLSNSSNGKKDPLNVQHRLWKGAYLESDPNHVYSN